MKRFVKTQNNASTLSLAALAVYPEGNCELSEINTEAQADWSRQLKSTQSEK